MSEIQSQTQEKAIGGQRCKKKATRIDLTPMVDLGFLLITFFVFTTSLSKPTAMHIALPNDANIIDEPKVTASKVLTLILAGDNRVGYYQGDDKANIQFTNYGVTGLRDIIMRKRQAVSGMYGNGEELTVLIKPSDECTFKNVVETLDEMLINHVTRYMMLDLKPEEQKQLAVHI